MDTPKRTEPFDNPPSAASTQLRPTKSKAVQLTKVQRAFQRAKTRVEKLQKEIAEKRECLEDAYTYYEDNISPVLSEYCGAQKEFVRLAAPFLTATDNSFSKRKLEDMATLLDIKLIEVIDIEGGLEEEFQEVAKKLQKIIGEDYALNTKVDDDSEGEDDDGGELSDEELQEMFDKMGAPMNVKEIRAAGGGGAEFKRIAAFMRQARDTEAFMAKNFPAPKPRKKTQKQLEKEEREKQIAEVRAKNINTVYKQLARFFHPDLETDPDKKQQKEELMKELTTAYEKGDLHTILRLELTWLQKGDGDITAMSDMKLDAYTVALEKQGDELLREYRRLVHNPRYEHLFQTSEFVYRIPGLVHDELKLMLRVYKKKVIALREDVETLRGPNVVKALQTIVQREDAARRAKQ
jgi:hypothetical protein